VNQDDVEPIDRVRTRPYSSRGLGTAFGVPRSWTTSATWSSPCSSWSGSVWVAAVAHWHLGNVEQRWSRRLAREEPPPTW